MAGHRGNPYHDAKGLFTSADKANGEIVDKHGNKYDVKHQVDDKGRHSYHAYHASQPYSPAAKIELKRGNKKAMHLGTAHEFRRKGLMTALHSHAEKHLGHRLEPDWALTPDGEAFYKRYRRK